MKLEKDTCFAVWSVQMRKLLGEKRKLEVMLMRIYEECPESIPLGAQRAKAKQCISFINLASANITEHAKNPPIDYELS